MSVTEISRISDELRRAFDGDPWHGLPLSRVLEGLAAAEAAAHPVPGAHSVWEIVLHVRGWIEEVSRRLAGEPAGEPPGGDWPPVVETGAAAWREALAALARTHEALLRQLASTPEVRLWDTLGPPVRDRALGTGVSGYVLLHGLVQHTVYHTAQIATLRRVLAARK